MERYLGYTELKLRIVHFHFCKKTSYMHVFTENNSEDINQNFNCDFSLGGWYSK